MGGTLGSGSPLVKPAVPAHQVAGGSGKTAAPDRHFGATLVSSKSRQTPEKYEQDQAWN